MNEYKILFTGTMGAGKTTAIGAVSETQPVITIATRKTSSSAATTPTAVRAAKTTSKTIKLFFI